MKSWNRSMCQRACLSRVHKSRSHKFKLDIRCGYYYFFHVFVFSSLIFNIFINITPHLPFFSISRQIHTCALSSSVSVAHTLRKCPREKSENLGIIPDRQTCMSKQCKTEFKRSKNYESCLIKNCEQDDIQVFHDDSEGMFMQF